ncbi:MAG: hypothetical protein DMD81_27825 [Candidatus Rokuibacteriota bacterium]|nr:MAG: hypothetical protein DMD81_27825 [Candidatus Rokubacteria bacterium]
MAPTARHPKLNALLISERVIREAETGVFSLIGIFDVLTTPTLPLTVPSLVVFAKMTDAEGEYDFELEVVSRNEDETITEVTQLQRFSVSDPLGSVYVVLHLSRLTFPRAGHYDFRLWANGRFADSTAIRVDHVESTEGRQR